MSNTKKKLGLKPMLGKHHTEEAKAKMRNPKSEETKKKISESHKGTTSWIKGK